MHVSFGIGTILAVEQIELGKPHQGGVIRRRRTTYSRKWLAHTAVYETKGLPLMLTNGCLGVVRAVAIHACTVETAVRSNPP